jgi:uncharacterized membrane protein (Fun14 family)
LATGAASFGAGFMMGYALKKVIRLILIALGAIAGIIFVALAVLQKQGYVSEIKWDKLASDLYTSANVTLSNVHMDTIQHTVSYLGLPLTGGLSLGIISGFLRG